MSRKNGKKQINILGYRRSFGNRKSTGVFPALIGGEWQVGIAFARPIERTDFNPGGSVKNPALAVRHKNQLHTQIILSEESAEILSDLLNEWRISSLRCST